MSYAPSSRLGSTLDVYLGHALCGDVVKSAVAMAFCSFLAGLWLGARLVLVTPLRAASSRNKLLTSDHLRPLVRGATVAQTGPVGERDK
jgi:hypothetical protein